jgi:hypothetical protein
MDAGEFRDFCNRQLHFNFCLVVNAVMLPLEPTAKLGKDDCWNHPRPLRGLGRTREIELIAFPLGGARLCFRYRNFSDTEIVLRVAKPNEPIRCFIGERDGLGGLARGWCLAEATWRETRSPSSLAKY